MTPGPELRTGTPPDNAMPPEMDLLRELNLEEALRVSEPYFKALYTSFKSPPRRRFSEQPTSGSLAGAPGEADDTSGLAEGTPPALKVWKKSPIRVRRRQRSVDRRFADTHLGQQPAHQPRSPSDYVLYRRGRAQRDGRGRCRRRRDSPAGVGPRGRHNGPGSGSPAPRPAVDSR